MVSNWSERSLFATVFHHQSKFNQIYLSFVFKCGVWCLCEIFLCKASPFPLDTFRCNPWAMTWRQSKCRIEYFNAFVICGPYVNIVRTSYTQSAYIKPHSVEIRMNPAIYTHSNNNTPYTVYLCSIWLKLRMHGLLIFHTKKEEEIHLTDVTANDGWKPMSLHQYNAFFIHVHCVFVLVLIRLLFPIF